MTLAALGGPFDFAQARQVRDLSLREQNLPLNCHPEAAESAAKRRTPHEGTMRLA